MPRFAQPDDLYRIRIPTEPELSPDGRLVAFTTQVAAPRHDGYRTSIWVVPADASVPARQVTLGANHDRRARFSPDGATLAFLSDRRLLIEEPPNPLSPDQREDGMQVHLLPVDGGEATRLSDLPRGVADLAWAPDGRRLVVVTTSAGATREEDARRRRVELRRDPTTPPPSDYRYLDRIQYLFNGRGFVDNQVTHLWLLDAATGEASQLTDGRSSDTSPSWSPDGRRIAYVTNQRRDWDLSWRSDVWVVEVETGVRTRITGGEGAFGAPIWLPDGTTLAVAGHRYPARAGSRTDIWLFPADGSDAGPTGGRNLSGDHDLEVAAAMNSDLAVGEEPRLAVDADGSSITFLAPRLGSFELWRIAVADGSVEQITAGRHYLSSFHQVSLARGGTRVAFIRSGPTELPDVHVLDVRAAGRGARRSGSDGRRLTALNADLLGEVRLSSPQERWSEVDGRRIQGWFYPALTDEGSTARTGDGQARQGPITAPTPLVVEIHGGPQTLYGNAPMWEWQVLAGSGISVFAANPRGSEGYGQDFAAANFRDWGPGPMRDILAGVDSLVVDGLADPDRLGVTGGSYGGYLTTWIVGHDHRFRAAITCRSVSDLVSLNLTGDLAGLEFGELQFGASPLEDPDFYREHSPLTHAERIRTPLLIQHAEQDLRCPIGQAEALFAVLRRRRRPVRLMRVPGESHELTRSGTPFRRVENLAQVRDWFVHYLVRGRRGLPPLPRDRAGK
jgi:dipeptidyl aminopeptidase/acylaminoacyl peptidase